MHGTLSPNRPPHCAHGDQIPLDYSIGDLFRDYGEQYIDIYRPDRQRIKLIRAIRICKTPALGGQVIECLSCRSRKYIYHSCGHSQCPCCQSIKRAQWQDKMSARMLQVPYVHITFTLPHQLNTVAKSHPKIIYNLLMRSAWKTIKHNCAQEENLGALPGMIAVLHTFGSDLKYHLHVHTLVTFGGLDKGGEWKWPKRRKKIASFRKMSSTYREIFLMGLRRLHAKEPLQCSQDLDQLINSLTLKRWVVHNTYPTADTSILENYLSRYINRVAISRNRFTYLKEQNKVQILYNNYRLQQTNKAAPKAILTLNPLVAIHKIMQHVLPPYFQKARYYGLHASCSYKKHQQTIPQRLQRNGQTIRTLFQILKSLLGLEPYRCDNCKTTSYVIHQLAEDPNWITTNQFIKIPP